ncbi:MAG: hypothetical protein HQL64_11990 [Magnetococcales bacterium]|nr:hypothetical protein [Magnetococcales bacterium]
MTVLCKTLMRYLIMLPAAILWLGGCQTVRYDMTPPSTEGGRACVTQCAAIRETCRGNAILRANGEREECEHQSKQALRLCLANADNKEKKSKCEKEKSSCWSSKSSSHCEGEYRTCYRQCGGTVTKVITE